MTPTGLMPPYVSSALWDLTYSLWAHLVQAIHLLPVSQEVQQDLCDPNSRRQFQHTISDVEIPNKTIAATDMEAVIRL